MPELTAGPFDAARDGFESAMTRGNEATRTGDFSAALAHFETALEEAEATRAAHRVDRARLHVAMVLLQMGDAKRGEEGLREIFLRTADPRIAFQAAYHLSASLRKQGRHERAFQFAQRAMEKAREVGEPEYLAPVHNLLGNLFLVRSFLDEALDEYRKSLALRESQPGDTRWARALLLENIGYCLVLAKQLDSGIQHLRRALDLAQEIGDRRCLAECLQDLCFAHLVRGEHATGIAFGEEALRVAVKSEYADVEENCHLLLGELGTRTGSAELREKHFGHLQTRHPEIPFLRDFLCAVDVTGVINLKR